MTGPELGPDNWELSGGREPLQLQSKKGAELRKGYLLIFAKRQESQTRHEKDTFPDGLDSGAEVSYPSCLLEPCQGFT